MPQRLPLALSVTALVVAVLGSTPLGEAAENLVSAVPPFAKQAGYAKTAGTAQNAKRLAGHTASRTPRPGQIPIVAANGKLAASLGAVGAPGAKGDPGAPGAKGDKGDKGDKGSPGVTSVTTVNDTANVAGGAYGGTTVGCPAGATVVAGGFNTANSTMIPTTNRPRTDGWEARAYNSSGLPHSIQVYVVCAVIGS